jgi:hypothetical protein
MPSGADYDLNPRVSGGQVEIITVANPAAGADFSHTIPDGYTYDVREIAFQLVCSGTVINRNPGHAITNASDQVLFYCFTTGSSTAGVTSQCCTAESFVGGGNSMTTVCHIWSLLTGSAEAGNTRLLPGWKIKSLINNLQAGDQISNIRLTVIRRPFPN